ncbi:MAG: hypothetical protein H0V18_16065 [Pyrinomonadaceae bacterium]|nr:hypothetical protein [Pyrinomonadaceae bacterium]
MKDQHNSETLVQTNSSITEERDYRLRWLRVSFWVVAAVLGFVHVWANRYSLNEDAMSYLDIADAYLHRDWSVAINSYWGPLYSWLIALALLIVKPSPSSKFSVLQLTNFAIYLVCLGCFDFLIHELIRFHRHRRAELSASKLVNLPDWAWLALGFPLFIWLCLDIIEVSTGTPDLIIAAVVFLVAGLLLRIRRRPEHWIPFVLLGIALGFGYLAKAVMFPLSFVFIAVSMLSAGNLRRSAPRVLTALALFFLIASPFIFAISRAKGRFTFSDSARINTAWMTRLTRWQGGRAGIGDPVHSPRKIRDTPPIYEFGGEIGGTYPLWYDPSYWHEGVPGDSILRGQLRAFGRNVQAYFWLFFYEIHYGLVVGWLSLYLLSRRRWMVVGDLAPYSSLIIPALAGLGIYFLAIVELRYVAPFVMLLWLGLFSGLRLPDNQVSRRLIACVMIVLMLMMVVKVTASSNHEASVTVSSLIAGEGTSAHEQWLVADGLHQMGVVPGDRVAVIGNSIRAFWGHLAGVRIVAEIKPRDANGFWAVDESVRSEAIETFARTGAKAIVTERPALCAESAGWRKIGNTNYYAYLLSR